MTKNAERKAKFQKIGAALRTDETSRDYFSGNASHFKIKSKPIQDALVSSRMFGPQMKSQQWERTGAKK